MTPYQLRIVVEAHGQSLKDRARRDRDMAWTIAWLGRLKKFPKYKAFVDPPKAKPAIDEAGVVSHLEFVKNKQRKA